MVDRNQIINAQKTATEKYEERRIYLCSHPPKWASIKLSTPDHTSVTLDMGINFGIQSYPYDYYEHYYADQEPNCDHWTKKYTKVEPTLHDTDEEAYDIFMKRIEDLLSQGWVLVEKLTHENHKLQC